MKATADLKKERIIIEKARQDKEYFAMLYDRYVDDVFRFVYYKINSKEDAEDITAKTFEKALMGIQKFKWRGYSFKTWLFVIAKNLVIDSYKQSRFNISIEQNKFDIHDSESLSPEDKTEIILNRNNLIFALDKLSPEYREVVILRYIEELSIKETMEITGKSLDSIKSLTKRALKKLKELIEGN